MNIVSNTVVINKKINQNIYCTFHYLNVTQKIPSKKKLYNLLKNIKKDFFQNRKIKFDFKFIKINFFRKNNIKYSIIFNLNEKHITIDNYKFRNFLSSNDVEDIKTIINIFNFNNNILKIIKKFLQKKTLV